MYICRACIRQPHWVQFLPKAHSAEERKQRAPVWATDIAKNAEGRRIELSIMYSSYWTSLGGVTR